MNKLLSVCNCFLLALVVGGSAYAGEPGCRFTAGDLTVELDKKGIVTGLFEPGGKNYATAKPLPVRPFVKLVYAPESGEMSGEDGTEVWPESLKEKDDVMTFNFPRGVQVDLSREQKGRYTILTVSRIDKNGTDVELLMWGPIMTTIRENYGDTLGVLYNDDFAIGYRALNAKTQMNAPHEYVGEIYNGKKHLNVAYPFDRSLVKGRVHDLKMSAAVPTRFGSYLMAFTYDATRERVRWAQYSRQPGMQRVSPLDDPKEATIVGSSIALYGRSRGQKATIREAVLDTIGTMELAEGLPHPFCRDGIWQKLSPLASEPYFIITDLNAFDTNQMVRACNYANRAGYKFVYRDTFFSSYGTFTFPRGYDAMKRVADTARDRGVFVGTHTLSAFLSGNSPYSQGKRGLLAGSRTAYLVETASAGSAELHVTADYDAYTKDLQLADEGCFQEKATKRCADGTWIVTLKRPLKKDVKRGTPLYNLHRNSYGGFIAGPNMTKEIAKNLAVGLNLGNFRQMSFDGLEAGMGIGLSNYGINLLVSEMYRHLDRERQSFLISDSSRGEPSAWHLSTRGNWGEPWGLGMRNSMMDYRYNNQIYFERNFMPKMLGWFQYVSGQDTIDMEWMLAKSAGFNAGFALVTDLWTLDGNGNTDEVMTALREWEAARQADAFTANQRQRLLDRKLDWHLCRVGADKWQLYCIQYQASPFTHRYDGKPMIFRLFNPYHKQPLELEFQAVNGDVTDIAVTQNGQKVTFSGKLPKGHYLIYKGGKSAIITNGRRCQTGRLAVSGCDALMVPQGVSRPEVIFKAAKNSVSLRIRTRTKSYPEDVYHGNQAVGPTEYPAVDSGEAVELRKNLLLKRPVQAYTFGTNKKVYLPNVGNVTDGVRTFTADMFGANFHQKNYLQIDMGLEMMLDTIHYYGNPTMGYPRFKYTPLNMLIAISTTPDFAKGTYRVVCNTDHKNIWGFGAGNSPDQVNLPEGQVFRFEPTPARYVRYYQYGCDAHITEGVDKLISLCELEAYAVCGTKDVRTAHTDDLYIRPGTLPSLPAEVIVEFGDDRKAALPVKWNIPDQKAFAHECVVQVEGVLQNPTFPVDCSVFVKDAPLAQIEVPSRTKKGAKSVRAVVGAAGVKDATSLQVRFYWDKAVLGVDSEGLGIRCMVPDGKIVKKSVNNESALVDLEIAFGHPLTASEASSLIEIVFGIDGQGPARIETKSLIFKTDSGLVTAENQTKTIFVE